MWQWQSDNTHLHRSTHTLQENFAIWHTSMWMKSTNNIKLLTKLVKRSCLIVTDDSHHVLRWVSGSSSSLIVKCVFRPLLVYLYIDNTTSSHFGPSKYLDFIFYWCFFPLLLNNRSSVSISSLHLTSIEGTN